jgi:hypothetical protein
MFLNLMFFLEILNNKIRKIIANVVGMFYRDKDKRHLIRRKIYSYKIKKPKFPYIYSCLETIKLLQQGYSIARFGDGELKFLSGISKYAPFDNKHTKTTNLFRKKLSDVLLAAREREREREIIISIIPFETDSLLYLQNKYRFMKYFNYNYKYGSAVISRNTGIIEVPLAEYRKIWENKKVCFVYSKKGRFDLEPRLFDNIKEYIEIDVPPVSAFDKYNEILAQCIKLDKRYLFIMAVGATATILAYDLSKLGYQALDLGHLPNCYREVVDGEEVPEKIPFAKD